MGANYEYPEASYERRSEIKKAHQTYIRSFPWTMFHRPRVPQHLREHAAGFGLPTDEFTDMGTAQNEGVIWRTPPRP